jgi:hypothetical protein
MLEFGLSVLLALILLGVCLHDDFGLRRAHARSSARILNSIRALVGSAAVLAAVYFRGTPAGAAALLLAAAALLVVPRSAIIRLAGGRTGGWQLRYLGWKAATVRRRGQSTGNPGLRKEVLGLVRQMGNARSPETEELYRLYRAECLDWLEVPSSPLIRAWRSVRITDLEQQLFDSPTGTITLDSTEATFRWHLFRQLSWLQQGAMTELTPGSRRRFEELLKGLEASKRPDTGRLIDLISRSANSWLTNPTAEGWTQTLLSSTEGPEIQAEGNRLWPSMSSFAGARPDETDLAYFSDPEVRAQVLRS